MIRKIAKVFIDIDECLQVLVDHLFNLVEIRKIILCTDDGDPDHFKNRNLPGFCPVCHDQSDGSLSCRDVLIRQRVPFQSHQLQFFKTLLGIFFF